MRRLLRTKILDLNVGQAIEATAITVAISALPFISVPIVEGIKEKKAKAKFKTIKETTDGVSRAL